MKKVLITGASGFIGRHLIPLLMEREYTVFPCYNSHKEDFPQGTHPLQVNLLNQEERRRVLRDIKPSHLIHLAWYVNPTDYLHSLENIDWIGASLDLFKEFGQNGGKRCLSLGSCAEYDWSEDILEENKTPLENDTLYAYAKNTTHEGLTNLSHRLGFERVWARIFWLYGPGESSKRFLNNLISTLLRGDTFTCKDPHKEVDLMYVKDVALGLVCALESNFSGPLNICSGQSLKIKDIINKVSSFLDCPQLIKFEEEATLPKKIKASSEKIYNLPGFHLRYPHEVGLKEYINYIKNDDKEDCLPREEKASS